MIFCEWKTKLEKSYQNTKFERIAIKTQMFIMIFSFQIVQKLNQFGRNSKLFNFVLPNT